MFKKLMIVFTMALVWLVVDNEVLAQKNKSKSTKKSVFEKEAPSSRNPGNQQKSVNNTRRTVKKGKGSNNFAKQLDKKVEEFHQRMKDNAKRRKKIARISKKPQYSDPSYFGHKRKPKKRPPGKRKFCKECEIIH